MVIQIIVLTFFICIGLVATFIAVIQYQRCSKLEQITNTIVSHFEEISRLIRESDDLIENPKLKEAFEHDDEVGGFFKNLEQMQKILNSYVGDSTDEN